MSKNVCATLRPKMSVLSLTIIGMLSAIGVILSYIEVPIVPGNDYLKMDLSDVPTVLATLVGGFPAGVLVSLLKNCIHLTSSNSFGIGQLINFMLGVTLSASVRFTYMSLVCKKSKKFTHAITFIVTIASFVLVGALLNLALTPVFNKLMGFPNDMWIILVRIGQSVILNMIKPTIVLIASFTIWSQLRKAINTNRK